MSVPRTTAESLAAEAALAFLRYALDSLEHTEHFAASARLPEAYIELREARKSLIKVAERLTLAANLEVPLLKRTAGPEAEDREARPAAKKSRGPGKGKRG